MELMRQREVSETLGSTPQSKEVEKALSKLKNGKAAGNSNILPEMLKVGRRNEDFVGMFTCKYGVGREPCPAGMGDAIIVPIPKKGNLHCCDNWRGIALLDVVGKLVANSTE